MPTGLSDQDGLDALWDEERTLPGGSRVTVKARRVPSSGVGWTDLVWYPSTGSDAVGRRVLADWQKESRSDALRAVVKLADDWFVYCAEQAERERVVAALAAPPVEAPDYGWNMQDHMQGE